MATVVWLWGPVAAWMAAIFVVSGMSVPPALPGNLSFTGGHVLAYMLLALLTIRATSGGRWVGVTPRSLAAGWIIAVVYGASDEWHQRSVPGRDASWMDWLSDATGASIALVALALAAAWIHRRRAGRAV